MYFIYSLQPNLANLLKDNHNFFLHLAMEDHHFSYIKEFLEKHMARGLYTTTKGASLESEKGECTRPSSVFRFISRVKKVNVLDH